MRNFYKKLALLFTTMALFTLVATSQTTVTYLVVDGGDDVEEYRGAWSTYADGYMDITSTDLELCTQNADNKQGVGIIFRGVAVPKSATIASAFLQFTCDDDDNQEGPLPVDIYGFKEANTTAPFADVPFNVTSRPKTTAKVTWSIPVWATKEARTNNEKSSDIKTIVQEIVNQSGWASGNNMGFILQNEELGNIHREAAAVEDGVPAAAAGLIITYSAGTGENKVNAESARLVYPNPSEGKVLIKNPSTGNFSYAVYSVIGSLVTSRDDNSGPVVELDMSRYSKGTYIVEVKSAAINVKNRLILK